MSVCSSNGRDCFDKSDVTICPNCGRSFCSFHMRIHRPYCPKNGGNPPPCFGTCTMQDTCSQCEWNTTCAKKTSSEFALERKENQK